MRTERSPIELDAASQVPPARTLHSSCRTSNERLASMPTIRLIDTISTTRYAKHPHINHHIKWEK
eukprot:5119309-Amphidinium_carterae.1